MGRRGFLGRVAAALVGAVASSGAHAAAASEAPRIVYQTLDAPPPLGWWPPGDEPFYYRYRDVAASDGWTYGMRLPLCYCAPSHNRERTGSTAPAFGPSERGERKTIL